MKISLRFHLIAFAFYCLAAVLMTWPLALMMGERMIGHPFGDTYEYTHHIWWINHALRTGQAPFFQPLLLYPHGLDAPLLWGIPLQSFPAWLLMFVMPLPVAFNLSAMLTLALNGWAMWVLSRQLSAVSYQQKGKEPYEPPSHCAIEDCRRQDSESLTSVLSPQSSVLIPSLLSGLVFMLYPAFQGQLAAGHTGLLALWPVPLFVLALLRVVSLMPRTPSHRGEQGRGSFKQKFFTAFLPILTAAALFVMSMWGSVLLLLYLVAPVTGLIVLILLSRCAWRALLRVGAVLALGALLALPFVLPILGEQVRQPPSLQEDGAVRYSASVLGIISPSFYHPLFSGLDYPHRVLGVDPFEGASYVGILAVALAVVAVVRVRQARWWLLLAIVTWAFSLGPLLKLYDTPLMVQVDGYSTPISLPWSLFQNLPVISIARTPARFNFAVGFAIAVMAGYGATYLWMTLKLRVRWIVLAGMMALIGFDYQFFWTMPTVSADIPEEVIALGERDDVRAVFDVPWEHLLTDKDAMYLQTGHGLPMIAGHISRRTPLNPAEGFLLQRTLDPALLHQEGVDIIILHREWTDMEGTIEALLHQRLGTPIYEDERLIVFEVPPYTGGSPAFIASVELSDEITDRSSIYFYASQPGSVTLTGRIAANEGRRAMLLLDDVPILEWMLQGNIGLNVPIEVETAGYHTLTIAVDPPCPANADPTLRCDALHISDVSLDDYAPLSTS